MIDTLDYLVTELLPSLFNWLNSSFLASGVSILGFIVAVNLLIIIIGAILIRV